MKIYFRVLCILTVAISISVLETVTYASQSPLSRTSHNTRTPTLILSGMAQFGAMALFRAEPKGKRLARFRGRRQIMAAYLKRVENALRPILRQATLSVASHNWPLELADQEKWGHTYSADFWEKMQGNAVRWDIHCNIGCADQSMVTQISPTFCMVKKTHDLRFDWFINTANPMLDRIIKAVIIEQAKDF